MCRIFPVCAVLVTAGGAARLLGPPPAESAVPTCPTLELLPDPELLMIEQKRIDELQLPMKAATASKLKMEESPDTPHDLFFRIAISDATVYTGVAKESAKDLAPCLEQGHTGKRVAGFKRAANGKKRGDKEEACYIFVQPIARLLPNWDIELAVPCGKKEAKMRFGIAGLDHHLRTLNFQEREAPVTLQRATFRGDDPMPSIGMMDDCTVEMKINLDDSCTAVLEEYPWEFFIRLHDKKFTLTPDRLKPINPQSLAPQMTGS